VTASRVFVTEDRKIYLKLRRWAKRRHHQKSTDWVVKKYWRFETERRDFATEDGVRLRRHLHTPIRRHIKVRGDKTPYDGDWSYWATRLGRHPEVPTRVADLLKRQRGRRVWCGLHFTERDGWEIDHVIPEALGGTRGRDNQQLLHRHCHVQKSAERLLSVRYAYGIMT